MIPRIWTLWHLPTETPTSTADAAACLGLGFLRDGALIGLLFLFIRLSQNKVADLSERTFLLLKTIYILIFAAFLGLLMLNTEFFRFFGSHLTINYQSLIFKSEEGFSLFFSDQLTRWEVLADLTLLPLVFLVGGLFFYHLKFEWFMRSRKGLWISIGILVAGAAAHAISLKDPVLTNLSQNFLFLTVKNILVGDELAALSAKPQREILDTLPLSHPSKPEPEWKYVSDQYPLVKATDHQLCQLGLLTGPACEADRDSDGVSVQTDCNDANSAVYPRAKDIPRNGIDEDCSGLDADPPNIIFIHWEGARAVNVGSIGYAEPCTPQFDRIVKEKGLLFRNAYSNATQTRWSLIQIYCSTLDRLSTKWIFRHNRELNLLAWPQILRMRGYDTRYFHSGEINFSSMRGRISQWFEKLYDRTQPPIKGMKLFHWGIKDEELFDLVYKTLKERKDNRPFLATVATLSLHYPLDLPDPKFAVSNPGKTASRVPNILRYSDHHLGRFLDKVMVDPQFENTIILVAADHGMNWYGPHVTGVQNVMWEDLVWIPIALIGKGWNINPGTDDEIRQLADIGPTILDRLGIDVPNPFIGHSLLRKFNGREPKAFFGNSNGGLSAGIRRGAYKYLLHLGTGHQMLFDLEKDRKEKNDLSGQPAQHDLMREFKSLILGVYSQNTQLIRENRIWSWDYWGRKERQ